MTNLSIVMKDTNWTSKELSSQIEKQFNKRLSVDTINSYRAGRRSLNKASFNTVRIIAYILDDCDGDYNDIERYAWLMYKITKD